MPISILNSQPRRLRTKRLREAARAALQTEGAPRAEVSILLTDDATIHALNCDYRGQDKSTDVLSFAQRDGPRAPRPAGASPPELLGDVVISVETAVRQAALHARPLED